MSMQSTFDDRGDSRPAHADRHGAVALRGGSMAKHLVTSLAGGLRVVYDAPQNHEVPDAFADVISRLMASEAASR